MRLKQEHLGALERVLEGSEVERIELVAGGERLVIERGERFSSGSRAGDGDPEAPPGLEVDPGDAQYFRWSDGDWIVAVEVTAHNTGEEPVAVSPANFVLTGSVGSFYPWSPVTTLAPTKLAPGAHTRGVVGFFTSGRNAEPESLTLSVLATPGSPPQATYVVLPERGEDRSASAPQAPPVPAAPVLDEQSLLAAVGAALREGALAVDFAEAVTFRWTDNDWIVTAQARLRNEGSEAALVTRALFQCSAHGLTMRPWGPVSTFDELRTLAPGESLEGMVGFFYHGSLPQPEQVVLAYGPVSRPAAYAELHARLDVPRLPQ